MRKAIGWVIGLQLMSCLSLCADLEIQYVEGNATCNYDGQDSTLLSLELEPITTEEEYQSLIQQISYLNSDTVCLSGGLNEALLNGIYHSLKDCYSHFYYVNSDSFILSRFFVEDFETTDETEEHGHYNFTLSRHDDETVRASTRSIKNSINVRKNGSVKKGSFFILPMGRKGSTDPDRNGPNYEVDVRAIRDNKGNSTVRGEVNFIRENGDSTFRFGVDTNITKDKNGDINSTYGVHVNAQG
jgi:hypothetical protein